MPFPAHPKVESDGALWDFDVSSAAGLLTVYYADADSTLKHVESIRIANMTMVHDFTVTQHYLVSLLPPFVYGMDRSHADTSFLDSHI